MFSLQPLIFWVFVALKKSLAVWCKFDVFSGVSTPENRVPQKTAKKRDAEK